VLASNVYYYFSCTDLSIQAAGCRRLSCTNALGKLLLVATAGAAWLLSCTSLFAGRINLPPHACIINNQLHPIAGIGSAKQ